MNPGGKRSEVSWFSSMQEHKGTVTRRTIYTCQVDQCSIGRTVYQALHCGHIELSWSRDRADCLDSRCHVSEIRLHKLSFPNEILLLIQCEVMFFNKFQQFLSTENHISRTKINCNRFFITNKVFRFTSMCLVCFRCCRQKDQDTNYKF